jgi:hypothetical protein
MAIQSVKRIAVIADIARHRRNREKQNLTTEARRHGEEQKLTTDKHG